MQEAYLARILEIEDITDEKSYTISDHQVFKPLWTWFYFRKIIWVRIICIKFLTVLKDKEKSEKKKKKEGQK